MDEDRSEPQDCSPPGVVEEGTSKPTQSQRPGGKKRKVALFVAFVGAGYSGMQHNPGCKTIEGELGAALNKAGAISNENAGDFSKVQWNRAARTDKGVSAAGNVVSLKMMIGFPDTVERINAQLPPQIRVLGFTRVTNSFDARKHCDRRRYEYILPAFMFDPAFLAPDTHTPIGAAGGPLVLGPGAAAAATAEPGSDAAVGETAAAAATAAQEGAVGQNSSAAAEAAARTAGTGTGEAPEPAGGGEACSLTQQDPGSEPASSRTADSSKKGDAPTGAAADGAGEAAGNGGGRPSVWRGAVDGAAAAAAAEAAGARRCRFTEEQRSRLNEVLAAFEGTHSFHNYTVRVPASDPAAKRYILSFKCAGTMELEGQQWVRMVVVGQSFMLHQIRKLVGTAVAVMRGVAPADAITLALDPGRVVVTPMAPELGLFLDECVFESYNDRWGNDREACVRLAAFQDQVDAFKRNQIYPHIASYDAKKGTNAAWLSCLTEGNFRFSEWRSSKVVHPAQEAAEAKLAQNGKAGAGSAKRKAASGSVHVNGEAKHARRSEDGAEDDREALRRREGPAQYIDKSMEAEWSD